MTEPHSEPDSMPGDGEWAWMVPIALVGAWGFIGWLVYKALA